MTEDSGKQRARELAQRIMEFICGYKLAEPYEPTKSGIAALIEQAFAEREGSEPEIDICELHQKMTAHLFPAYSNTDERFLCLALAGEVGELCNMVKKRWRDGADLSDEIRDEIADIRVYLELTAKCFGIAGEKLNERVQSKLSKVVERWKDRLGRGSSAGTPAKEK